MSEYILANGKKYFEESYLKLDDTCARLKSIVDQVDDVLIYNWIEVKDGDYRKALYDLVSFSNQVENDPSVSQTAADLRNLMLRSARALYRESRTIGLSEEICKHQGYSGDWKSIPAWIDEELIKLNIGETVNV